MRKKVIIVPSKDDEIIILLLHCYSPGISGSVFVQQLLQAGHVTGDEKGAQDGHGV